MVMGGGLRVEPDAEREYRVRRYEARECSLPRLMLEMLEMLGP